MSLPLFQLWTATVGREPSAIAVIEGSTGRKWTRSALAAAIGEWSAAYPKLGRKDKKSRIALAVPNGTEWFTVFLGLTASGAVPIPMDPLEPAEGQFATARALGCRFLWWEGRLHLLEPLRRLAALNSSQPHDCLVKMTSGSSGAPKALVATHAQMEADGRQICATMGISPQDLNLAAIPLGYSYGLGNLVLPLILQGTGVVCASSPLPNVLASEVRRHRATVFPAVPPLLKALVAGDVPVGSLRSLRLVVSAGSALSEEISRGFAKKFKLKVHGFYGTSETGGISYDRTGEATLAGRSVGTPLVDVNIRIGKEGRLLVTSPAVLGTGRFSPADRAWWNPLGELVLRGRTDRMVKVGGRRIDLAEIEKILRSVAGIHDAFATSAAGPDGNLAVAVVSRFTSAQIRAQLRSRIASWKVPDRIVVLAEFPVSERGKIDFGRLRQVLSAPRIVSSISTLRSERQMSASR